MLSGWAWPTSVTLAVIARPSKNVGDVEMSPAFFGVSDKYGQHLSKIVNRRLYV